MTASNSPPSEKSSPVDCIESPQEDKAGVQGVARALSIEKENHGQRTCFLLLPESQISL